ncbi:MAG: alpha/beta hydrolase-fold protein [Bacteroidota bacterium]
MKEILLCAFLLVLSIYPGFAQTKNTSKIEIGERITIQSKILDESRELLVYSPKNSPGKNLKHPVIYLFDANALFLPAVGAVEFMNKGSYLPQIPEAYIVGIVNTNRNRDMPVPQEIEKTNGAKNFYRFLSEEVVPYINKTLSTSGLNILAGHSQGGLFATYAAVQNPKLFPFAIAMDAPMTVTKSVEAFYSEAILKNCNTKYVSVESLYGWENAINTANGCLEFSQIKVAGENHETMPYQGFYQGLKFLFNNYLPPVQDWPLQRIRSYYDSLANKYRVIYPIPFKVMLESAKQNIGQSKKAIAVDLIIEHDKIYGSNLTSQQLLAKANAITKGPDNRIEYNLSHPPPGEDAIKPFLGKWSGLLVVPGGMNLSIDWEIVKVNGGYQMVSDMMKQFKSKSDFLYVNEKKELVWGRKHNGGGIYISIGTLSADGLTITGTEDQIGFDLPPGMPAFKQNSFEFKKQ